MIDRNRGDPALKKFFHETFAGTLVTDFWAAYDHVACSRHQYCLAHFLRELEKVDLRHASEEWQAFSKKTRRLFQDALRLRARADFTPEHYASRIQRLYERLLDLALAAYADRVRRLLDMADLFGLAAQQSRAGGVQSHLTGSGGAVQLSKPQSAIG